MEGSYIYAFWGAPETRVYTVTTPGSYTYYRLNMTAGLTWLNYIGADDFELRI